MKCCYFILLISMVCLLFVESSYGTDKNFSRERWYQTAAEDLLDLPLEELVKIKVVTIASGHRQTVQEAPAVTSVITAEEIESMGAQTLSQVLETVAGLHVARNAMSNYPIYVIRGIFTPVNAEVLFLVNGIPLKDLSYGNRGLGNWEWPLANIERIEVIRGPGSAIYGADAFAGVINVITKTYEDLKGVEAGVRWGSFNTKEAWLLHGGSWAGFTVAASLQYLATDGHQPLIEEDIQTSYDQQFGTQASLTPNKANLAQEFLGTQVEFSRDSWLWRIGYQQRDDLGMGVGSSLDLEGSLDAHLLHSELIYHPKILNSNWDITAQLSFQELSNFGIYHLFPPQAFGGAYPAGMISHQGTSEHHVRFETHGFYTGWADHRLRLGIGYEYADLYDMFEARNHGPGTSEQELPLNSSIVNFTDTPSASLPETGRQLHYLSVQDEWELLPTWTLTTGLRYDEYSDFGNTLNPRLALVWRTSPKLTTKLLYGTAFRAPSFVEFYLNDSQVQGNPQLKPEAISTWELGFNYAVMNFNWATNVFHYRIDDKIAYTRDTNNVFKSQNVGQWEGYGLELEGDWQIKPDLNVSANYSYQHTVDMEHDDDIGMYPQQAFYLQTTWLWKPAWQWQVSTHWIADRQRKFGDSRPAVADYATVDLTLRYQKPDKKGISWGIGVHNLLDKQAKGPISRSTLPKDWPLDGRSGWIEMQYRF